MSDFRSEMVAKILANEAAGRLLLEATQLDRSGWVVCPGPGCTLHLLLCFGCHATGCYAHRRDPATCPNTLLDHTGTCRRCGHAAGMNRTLKLGHYTVGDAWRQLHPDLDPGR